MTPDTSPSQALDLDALERHLKANAAIGQHFPPIHCDQIFALIQRLREAEASHVAGVYMDRSQSRADQAEARVQEDTAAFQKAMTQAARQVRSLEQDVARVQAENTRLVNAKREAEVAWDACLARAGQAEAERDAARTAVQTLTEQRDEANAMLRRKRSAQ